MLIFFRAIVTALFFLPVFAQQPLNGAAKQNSKNAASSMKRLTIDDVIAMASAGISDDVIIARLRKEDKPFDLSPDDLIRLKKAKISDSVLKTMLDPRATPAVATPAPPSVQPVIVQATAIPGIIGSSRSGATPSGGTSTDGDPNDPLTPHDSGIYLYTKDRDGKPQMVVLERAAYQGSKTGGVFTSAMTYGIVKAKTKAVIPGPHAGVRVGTPAPVFYFYFDDKQAGLGKTYFGVNSLSNPNQFALLKLDVNKSNRETTIGQFSALGTASGSDSHAMVPFKSERIRTGLYKVTVDVVKDGEYCFLASNGMVMTGMAGAYGAGSAGAADIFDFSVRVE